MKKILVRAGMNPWEIYSPDEALSRNLIGNNSGNLIYAYGVFRTLGVEGVRLEADHYQAGPALADRINQEYSAFVIPLADAFRNDFVPNLVSLTKLVKQLKIPCIVTGVGLRTSYEPNIKEKKPYDHAVKNFMKAVLKRSAMVGVRGEITGDYLKRLGFREEMDYRTIGCPSMYALGPEHSVKKPRIKEDSKISVNYSVMSPSPVIQMLNQILKENKNSQLVTQRMNELELLYLGIPYQHQQNKPDYPTSICDPVYQEQRVRFFINAIQWIEAMRDMDLSIGGRMHGNIAAWLSGTPAVFLPHDGRMRELCEFHRLPSVPSHEVRKDETVEELIEKADWQSAKLCQELNYRRYLDFLTMNGLKVREQKEKGNIEKETIFGPETKKSEVCQKGQGVPAITACKNLEEVALRWKHYERINLEYKNRTIREIRKRLAFYEPASVKKDAGRLALRLFGKMK